MFLICITSLYYLLTYLSLLRNIINVNDYFNFNLKVASLFEIFRFIWQIIDPLYNWWHFTKPPSPLPSFQLSSWELYPSLLLQDIFFLSWSFFPFLYDYSFTFWQSLRYQWFSSELYIYVIWLSSWMVACFNLSFVFSSSAIFSDLSSSSLFQTVFCYEFPAYFRYPVVALHQLIHTNSMTN